MGVYIILIILIIFIVIPRWVLLIKNSKERKNGKYAIACPKKVIKIGNRLCNLLTIGIIILLVIYVKDSINTAYGWAVLLGLMAIVPFIIVSLWNLVFLIINGICNYKKWYLPQEVFVKSVVSATFQTIIMILPFVL